MSIATYIKDPSEIKDYGFDWSLHLGSGETIDASAWSVDSGITEELTSIAGAQTIIWLSGGSAGTTYTITNTIDTSSGQRWERSFEVVVQEL